MSTRTIDGTINGFRLAAGFGCSLISRKIGIERRPIKLNYCLTYRCNSRCVSCGIWKIGAKKGKEKNKYSESPFSEELKASELDEFFSKNNYFKWVDITGGEITTRPDIEEIIDIVIKRLPDLYLLHFPTNGSLPEKVVALAKRIRDRFDGRIVISVSIDGDEELHDRIRGVKGSFKLAAETLKRLREIKGVESYIGYTCSSFNAGRIRKMYSATKKELPSLSPDDIHLNIADENDYYHNNKDMENASVLADQKTRLDAISDIDFLLKNKKKPSPFNWLERRFLKSVRRLVRVGNFSNIDCRALSATISLRPDGKIVSCMFKEKEIWSIRKDGTDLKKLYASERYIRKIKENKICRECHSACEAYPSILL